MQTKMSKAFGGRILLVLCACFHCCRSSLLAIDSKITAISSDCYERLAIGDKLPQDVVFKVVEGDLRKTCEAACDKEQRCVAFSFGLSTNGGVNGSCELGSSLPHWTRLDADPDFDVYAKKDECREPTPTLGGPPSYEDFANLSASHHANVSAGHGHNKTCFRRLLVGRRLVEPLIRRSLPCLDVEACQQECDSETHFTCEGFNYREDAGDGRGLCEMTAEPAERLDPGRDFRVDREFSYFERDRDAALECEVRGSLLDNNAVAPWTGRPAQYPPPPQYHRPPGGGGLNRPHPGYLPTVGFYGKPAIGGHPLEGGNSIGGYGQSYGHGHGYPVSAHGHYGQGGGHYGHGGSYPPSAPAYGNGGPYGQHGYGQQGYGQGPYGNMPMGAYGQGGSYLPPQQGHGDHHGGFGQITGPGHGPVSSHGHGHGHVTGPAHVPGTGPGYGTGPGPVTGPGTGPGPMAPYPPSGPYLPPTGGQAIGAVPSGGHHGGGKPSGAGQGGGMYLPPVTSRPPLIQPTAPNLGCYKRVRTGFRLHRGAVQESSHTPTLRACQQRCLATRTLHCVTLAYRHSTGADNCLLSAKTEARLDPYNDLLPEREFDVYAREETSTECPLFAPNAGAEPPSECFSRVRTGQRMVRPQDAVIATSLGDCQHKCAHHTLFTCHVVSFRPGPAVIGDVAENCEFTDVAFREFDVARDLRDDPTILLYARGGHGCASAMGPTNQWPVGEGPALVLPTQGFPGQGNTQVQPAQELNQCYAGFGVPAKLISPGSQLIAASERHCQDACTSARERYQYFCLAVSYSDPVPGATGPNCLLSDVAQRDLRPGHDFVRAPGAWLFAWDAGNPRCTIEDPAAHFPGHFVPGRDDASTWQRFTVSGRPCRRGSVCAEDTVAGFWKCAVDGEADAWDYCCRPGHRCGFSEGHEYPWCYVGSAARDQWRPCSTTFQPNGPPPRGTPAPHWPVAYLHLHGPPTPSAGPPPPPPRTSFHETPPRTSFHETPPRPSFQETPPRPSFHETPPPGPPQRPNRPSFLDSVRPSSLKFPPSPSPTPPERVTARPATIQTTPTSLAPEKRRVSSTPTPFVKASVQQVARPVRLMRKDGESSRSSKDSRFSDEGARSSQRTVVIAPNVTSWQRLEVVEAPWARKAVEVVEAPRTRKAVYVVDLPRGRKAVDGEVRRGERTGRKRSSGAKLRPRTLPPPVAGDLEVGRTPRRVAPKRRGRVEPIKRSAKT